MTIEIYGEHHEFGTNPPVDDHASKVPRHQIIWVPGRSVSANAIRDEHGSNMQRGSGVDHDTTRVATVAGDVGRRTFSTPLRVITNTIPVRARLESSFKVKELFTRDIKLLISNDTGGLGRGKIGEDGIDTTHVAAVNTKAFRLQTTPVAGNPRALRAVRIRTTKFESTINADMVTVAVAKLITAVVRLDDGMVGRTDVDDVIMPVITGFLAVTLLNIQQTKAQVMSTVAQFMNRTPAGDSATTLLTSVADASENVPLEMSGTKFPMTPITVAATVMTQNPKNIENHTMLDIPMLFLHSRVNIVTTPNTRTAVKRNARVSRVILTTNVQNVAEINVFTNRVDEHSV